MDRELVSDKIRAVNKRTKTRKADAIDANIGRDKPFGQRAAKNEEMPREPGLDPENLLLEQRH